MPTPESWYVAAKAVLDREQGRCPRCQHGAHEQYGDCGEITGTLWSGSGAEPDYCGCRYPKSIEHFCAECFGEMWTGDPVYVLGTGPNDEVAARCAACQRRSEQAA